MQFTPHPSRSAPLCKDCRHASHSLSAGRTYCAHPSTPVDPVDGGPILRAEYMRHPQGTVYVPHPISTCGREASLFVARDGIHDARSAALDVLKGARDLVMQRRADRLQGAGLDVGADQRWVGAGIPVAELRVERGDGQFEPAVDRA